MIPLAGLPQGAGRMPRLVNNIGNQSQSLATQKSLIALSCAQT
jgi:hypothetical protein